MPKTRIELLASLATLNARRPGLAKLVEDGRAQPHELGLVDNAISQVTSELEAFDRREAQIAAQSRPRARVSASKPAVDLADQRAHLEELREQRQAELAQMADSRKELLLDGSEREITAIEAEMAKKTADLDRIRDSLVELATREARSAAQTAAAERKRREADLDAKLVELGAAGAELADLVTTAEPILDRIDTLEHEVSALASNLGRSFADTARRRPLFSRLCVGRLGVKVAAFYVSPAALVGIEERLRTAPDVPTPRTRERKPDRGPVPFAEGLPEPTVDHQAEQMIKAQQQRAKAMTAGR